MKPDMPRDSENPQQCDSLAELPAWQLGTWGAHTDPLSVAVPEAGVTSVSSVSALGTGPPYAWGGPSCSMGSFAERKGMSHVFTESWPRTSQWEHMAFTHFLLSISLGASTGSLPILPFS